MYALQPEPEVGRRWRLVTGSASLTLIGFALSLFFSSQLRFAKPQPAKPPLRVQMVHHPVVPPAAPPASASPPPKPTKVLPPQLRPKRARKKKTTPAPTRPVKPMPAAAPPSPRPVKPPPLVVGLTLSSTTSTGKGPRFGVGNTLMGTPASVAATPEANPTAHTAFDPRVKSANRSFTKTRSAATLRAGSSPQYPASAKRDGIEGVVVLLITIGKQGRVLSAQVLKGLLPALDESAIQAAKQTLWTPAMADGKPTQSTRRFNVRFRLQG